MNFVTHIFDTSDFPARWNCGVWTSAHGWLHILSDLTVWLAYLAIPLVLAYFTMRRKDLPFRGILLLFQAFILACGTTHLMEAIIFWWPAYRLAGLIKLATAIVSWATVIAIVPIVPKVLAMRTPEELEREIQERMRVEDALRTSEERFRLLVAGVDEYAIFLLDARGFVISWNAGAERSNGYAATEIIGQHFSCFYPTEDVANGRPGIELTLAADKGKCEVEGRRVRKDGSRFWANIVITALRDEHGNLKGFSKITRDMTEQKRVEDQLRRAHDELEHRVQERTLELARTNRELQDEIQNRNRIEEQLRQAQKLEAVGRLAGGVAHDFNNLLTVSNGYCDILMSGMNDPDTSRVMLEQIHRAGDRAAALTQQLLAYSRKQILQPREFCLSELVRGMEKFLIPLIREDIKFITTLDPQPCRVKADPHQIEQVLMNLAVNARDAMPRGGRLTIATQHVELGESFQSEFPEVRIGPYVQLTVTDNGVGMDQETLEHVFEPFFTTKELGQGTGLGLAMVYGIVKQSGGHIQVTSKPGQGTCFQIFLPRLRTEAVQLTPTVGTSSLVSGLETILLVEDEEAVRTFLEVVLREAGYHVLAAANGESALELSARYSAPIDMLVTDVVMPGISGGQVAEALRGSRPEMRVLFLSGHTEDALVHHGVRNAKAAFLQKPFTAAAITRKIRNVLDDVKV